MIYDIDTIKETYVYKRNVAHMPPDFAEQLLLAANCTRCDFEDYHGIFDYEDGELDMTFIWSNSPQGNEYWATLYDGIPDVS